MRVGSPDEAKAVFTEVINSLKTELRSDAARESFGSVDTSLDFFKNRMTASSVKGFIGRPQDPTALRAAKEIPEDQGAYALQIYPVSEGSARYAGFLVEGLVKGNGLTPGFH